MDNSLSKEATDWREGRRLRAFELKQEGWSQQRIVEALGVSKGAVSQWMKRARQGGVQALRKRMECTHSTGQSRKSTSLKIGCRVTSSSRRRDWLPREETTPGSSSSNAALRWPPQRSAPPRSAGNTTFQRVYCYVGGRSTRLAARQLSQKSSGWHQVGINKIDFYCRGFCVYRYLQGFREAA
ncbi:MAG: helix-turn-helix domain-containing protein, partial [Actinomycetota bacterium]|nr:helix-turn-helix domain-containing protein [Actinomycetota bacterium]